jgi:hypothetical protein
MWSPISCGHENGGELGGRVLDRGLDIQAESIYSGSSANLPSRSIMKNYVGNTPIYP